MDEEVLDKMPGEDVTTDATCANVDATTPPTNASDPTTSSVDSSCNPTNVQEPIQTSQDFRTQRHQRQHAEAQDMNMNCFRKNLCQKLHDETYADNIW